MPSFADSIFLFVLALLLFGPKRLPVLARELGKWVGEFRRASNEFKMQMEDELRASEQSERQKQIAAMEAAAPVPPPLTEAEPEHPHMRHAAAIADAEPSIMPPPRADDTAAAESGLAPPPERSEEPALAGGIGAEMQAQHATETAEGVRPLPIAVSGSLRMMPPATGLPVPRSRSANGKSHTHPDGNGEAHNGVDALGALIDSLPEAAPENVHHGD